MLVSAQFHKLLLVILAVGVFHAALAANPSSPDLNNPADEAVMVDIYNPRILWHLSTDPGGGTITYDLYLGTTASPPLFRKDLFDGWMSDEGTEFLGHIFVDDETYMEFFTIFPFLSNDTKYYWKVVARNDSGEETSSRVFSFTTARENTPPSAPTVISPAANATNVSRQLTLQWKASVDPDGDPVTYKLYFGTNTANVNAQPLVADNLTSNSYTIPYTLADQQTYYWQVEAVDGYDGTVVSSDGTFTSIAFTVENYINDAPTVPSPSLPQNSAVNTGNMVRLLWNISTDRDGDAVTYDVYADQNADPVTKVASGLTVNYYDDHFDGANKYYWKVIAKDGKGGETTSAVFSFSTWSAAPSFSMEMVDVEGGTFTMGQSDEDKLLVGYTNSGHPVYHDITNEHPAHPVTVSSFKMAKYLVTNAQFAAFLNAIKDDIRIDDSYTFSAHSNYSFYYQDVYFADKEASPGKYQALCQVFDATQTGRPVGYEAYKDSPIIWDGASFSVDPFFENHPVRFIYYTAAKYFADWAGYELPTEAEWEFAASGGNLTHGYTYSGSNNFSDVAADPVPSFSYGTQPVGTKQPNELGIYDMSGNVAEICLDIYDPDFYKKSPPAVNPVGPSFFTTWGHSTRGGSTGWPTIHGRVKSRDFDTDSFAEGTGVRLVKRTTPLLTITGRITRQGYAVPDVLLNGLPVKVTSSRVGTYFVAIPSGWSGTITPQLQGYAFSPASITVTGLDSDATFNFTMTILEERSISGTIEDNSGQPLAGVTLSGAAAPVTTASDGRYTVKVYKDWTGTIIPSLEGYSFSPASRTFGPVKLDISDVDFTATQVGTHQVSGNVTDDAGQPLEGALISGFPTEVTTGIDGTYSVSVTAGWTGTITPSLNNYEFNPAALVINEVHADRTDVNFTGTYTGDYIIAGTIKDNTDNPLPGVTVSAGSQQSVTTNADGKYLIAVPSGWSGNVTPALNGYQFSPEERTFTAVHSSFFDQDFHATATVTSIDEGHDDPVTVYPNPGNGVFHIRLENTNGTPVFTVLNSHGSVVSGTRVYSTENGYELNLEATPAGMYTLIIGVNGRTYIRKLVMIKS